MEVTHSYPWPVKDETQMELFDNYASELTKKIEDTTNDNF